MSMSCSISSTVTSLGSAATAVENFVPLVLGHAGRRLVEQQHARPAGDGDGDFQQPLLAVRQHRGALVDHVGEVEALEDFDHFGNEVRPAADDAPPVEALAAPLGHRQPDGLQRRQVVEQLIDLEGAHDPQPHPLVRRAVADVLAVEQNAAGGRPLHAGEQIDQRGLAGAVRPDQGVAGALLDAAAKRCWTRRCR